VSLPFPENIAQAVEQRIQADSLLAPYRQVLERRISKTSDTLQRLVGHKETGLADFASGHEYFGLHKTDSGWVFREWAPNALSIHLLGDFSNWQPNDAFALKRISQDGTWEIFLEKQALHHEALYCLHITWPGGQGRRIPAWARRVVQDERTLIFNAQVWKPESPYIWNHSRPASTDGPLLIYEAHVGMAQEAQGIGSFRQFADTVLPRVKEGGYNAIQLMAVAEHPYYASFGYQVANFFACSSRFGTPEELKALVDKAHGLGIMVFMDLVHSHAVNNENEGLSRFDGTEHQYFHQGARGRHEAWNSRLFDYAKPQVLHFLLSNCRFWLDEYRIDGFRFDGVTSMIYLHHGLGRAFTKYDEYFNSSVDEDALAYLSLANALVHEVCPGALTIAEDVSGMPGLAVPVEQGGTGFDFRFAMGLPDYWIKLTKDTPDEAWPTGELWHELNNRRHDEKSISYAESHDQALVGDQTLIFRLIGADIYEKMSVLDQSLKVDRGIALHKMIRLATLATAGHGYLNFMGNEFGHPEWIDFPRQGNNWSYQYARRQWSLANDGLLRYRHLDEFDRAMLALARKNGFPDGRFAYLLLEDNSAKVLAFLRAGLIFAFNFHPEKSHQHFKIPAPPGDYKVVLDTDETVFGGFGRQDTGLVHHCLTDDIHRHYLSLYLPTRTSVVLEAAPGKR
jgi:1,4-alpha-glucan branching enzyme